MEMQISYNDIERSGDFKEYSFGVDEKNMAFILDILRNKLYSDKLLAILREYSCNAIDSHKESGQGNRPIEVTLPTILDPTLIIKDYGAGLSPEQIENVYSKYCSSTKRDSNEYIGALGLGAKSAFSYTDTFVVESIVDGFLYSYTCYIDETGVGSIALLSKNKVDAESGVTIKIAIRKEDITTLIRKAQDFFKFWTIRPIINTVIPEQVTLVKGNDWGLVEKCINNSGNIIALMGNIPYPVNQGIHDFNLINYAQTLILYFDIGELSISASREALEYTDATQEKIKTKLEKVKGELLAESYKAIEEAKTFKEVMNVINTSGFHVLLNRSAQWKDEKISELITPYKKYPNLRLQQSYYGVNSGSRYWRQSCDQLSSGYKNILLIIDCSEKTIKSRVLKYCNENHITDTRGLLLSANVTEAEDFAKFYGIETAYLSKYTPDKVASTVARHSKEKVLELTIVNSHALKMAIVDMPATGYFVEGVRSLDESRQISNLQREACINRFPDIPPGIPKIYVLTPAQVKEHSGKLIHLKKKVAEVNSKDRGKVLYSLLMSSSYVRFNNELVQFSSFVNSKIPEAKDKFKKTLELSQKTKVNNFIQLENYDKNIVNEIKQEIEEVKKEMEQFPLLSLLISHVPGYQALKLEHKEVILKHIGVN